MKHECSPVAGGCAQHLVRLSNVKLDPLGPALEAGR